MPDPRHPLGAQQVQRFGTRPDPVLVGSPFLAATLTAPERPPRIPAWTRLSSSQLRLDSTARRMRRPGARGRALLGATCLVALAWLPWWAPMASLPQHPPVVLANDDTKARTALPQGHEPARGADDSPRRASSRPSASGEVSAAAAAGTNQGAVLPERYELDAVGSSRSPESDRPLFESPIDVAVDGDRIWVLDVGVPGVAQLDASGDLLAWMPLAVAATQPVALDARDARIAIVWPDRGEIRTPDGAVLARWTQGATEGKAVGVALQADGGLVVAEAVAGPTGGVALAHRRPDATLRERWRDDAIAVRSPRGVDVADDGLVVLAADGAVYLWRSGAIVGLARATGREGPPMIDAAFDGMGVLLGMLGPRLAPDGPTEVLRWQIDDPQRPTLAEGLVAPAAIALALGPGSGWLALVDEGDGDFDRVGLFRGSNAADLRAGLVPWSRPPPAVGVLRGPRFVAVGDDGDVFLGDDADRVHRWSPDGVPLDAWAIAGVRDVAAGLADADGPCVLAIAGATCMDSAGRVGTAPTVSPGGWPSAISVRDGRLLLIDLGHQRASVHDASGAEVARWDLPAGDGYAAIVDADMGPRGASPARVALAESGEPDVGIHLALDGGLLARAALPAGTERVAQVEDNVFSLATDGRIWKHDRDGEPLSAWLPGPNAAGTPGDLAVGPADHVFVTDPAGDRVLRYRPAEGESLAPPPSDGEVCEVHVDKRAAPAEVGIGDAVTVTLSVRGACPRGDGALDVVVALDTSASMAGPPLAAAQRAVAAFLGELDAGRSRVGLVGFGRDTTLAQAPTGDLASIPRALGALTTGGTTRYAPALELAGDALDALASRAGVPRAVVLMSDGRPNDLDRALPAALGLQGRGVELYTIGFGPNAELGLLRRMASSAGHFFEAPTGPDLVDVFRALGRQVRSDRLLDQARIHDELPADMDYVPASGSPAPRVTGRTLQWTLLGVSSAGVELSYQVRPRLAGIRPTNAWARLTYIDGVGFSDERDFPVPHVRVRPSLYLPWLARAQCRPRRVDVALVIDTSGSMDLPVEVGGERKLDAARAAATGFLDAMRFPDDRAAIVSFDASARTIQALTADESRARVGLDLLRVAPGTRIDAGLAAGASALRDPARRRAVTPLLVLLTDGRPSEGTVAAVRSAARSARDEGIRLFTIGLGADVDAALLAELAGDPARSFIAPDTATLRAVYDRLAGSVLCE